MATTTTTETNGTAAGNSHELQVERIPRHLIDPSPFNPRKDFDAAKLEELRASLHEQGVLMPLLVRPAPAAGRYELVDGERRYRAAEAGKAKAEQGGAREVAALEFLPCLVRDLSDDDAREIQLTANLQREDLSALEEAEGFAGMLALRDEAGAPRYTVKSLAVKLGRSHDRISAALKLLNLPSEARDALASGKLPRRTAELIGRVPGEAARAAVTQEVLQPKYKSEPLTKEETARLITEEFTRSLAKARWTLEDATLVPIVTGPDGERRRGGACTTCPFYTGNATEEKLSGQAANMCTNLDCYKAKEDAEWARWQREHTDAAKHKRALARGANGKVFLSWGGPGELSGASPYVKLSEKPSDDLLKAGVKPKAVLPWRQLVAGRGVETVVARTKTGGAVELADRALAIAAAKLNQHAIFRTEAGEKRAAAPAWDSAEAKAKRAREEKVVKIAYADGMDALEVAIEKKPLELFLDAWLEVLTERPWRCSPVLERRKLGVKTDLAKLAKNWPPSHKLALCAELVIADDTTDLMENELALALGNAYGVDLKAIAAKARSQVADEEAAALAKAQPKKPAGKVDSAANVKTLTKLVAQAAQAKLPKSGLGKKIVEVLVAAGTAGINVKEIAAKTKVKPGNVFSWFYTSGKKIGAIKKVGEATYAYVAPAVAEKAGAK